MSCSTLITSAIIISTANSPVTLWTPKQLDKQIQKCLDTIPEEKYVETICSCFARELENLVPNAGNNEAAIHSALKRLGEDLIANGKESVVGRCMYKKIKHIKL